MILKILLVGLVLVCHINVYALTNDGQINFLREQVAGGDYWAMYRLGKILYEDGQIEQGIALLNESCTVGKEVFSCNYIKSIDKNSVKSYNYPNKQFITTDDDNIEIYCSHTRDYRDKRVDQDWVEKLYNYGVKSAQDASMDPTNYDMNYNFTPDLLTSIISAAGLVAKVGKKTIKPINHDQFSCRAASNRSLDYLIKNKIVIPIALFNGALMRHSEEISPSAMVRVGDSINFNVSTIKSDLDYFGFYIPRKNVYILWKFDDLGNFKKLDNVIRKDSKNPSFSEIKNYID